MGLLALKLTINRQIGRRLVLLLVILSATNLLVHCQQQQATTQTKATQQIGQTVAAGQPQFSVSGQAPSPSASLNNALATVTNIKPLLNAALAAGAKAGPVSVEQQQVGGDQQQVVAGAANIATLAATGSSIVPQQGPSPQNFGNEDPIVHLDYSTINDEILSKNTANFVFFNANPSNCRHCGRLFDIWKELAVDIRWWKQVVKLFSINCSDDDNIEVCKRADVTQLPQVRFYWVQSQSLDQDGQRLRILGKSVHALRHLIMDKVFDSYKAHNKLLEQKTAVSQPGIPISTKMGIMNPALFSQLISGNSQGGGLMNMLMGSGGLASLLGQPDKLQGIGQLMSGLLGSTGSGGMRSVSRIQPMPSNWPELDAIEVSDTEKLIDMQPLDPAKSHIGALLVMETQEFLYNGLEVILDLCPYSSFIYIARVKDQGSQLTKNLTKRDDVQAPALIYLNSARESKLIVTAPKYTNDEDLRRVFVRSFEKRLIKSPVKRLWSMPQETEGGPQNDDTKDKDDAEIEIKANSVYMNDLTNALRISLMEQVFKHPDLNDDQYNALVKYIYAIINYFPFQSDENLKFFKRLHSWLQNQVSPVDMAEYKKQFHDIDETLPKRDWMACMSISNTKSIPARSSKAAGQALFENPAQLGKMVSNITKFLRNQQHQTGKLTSLLSVLASNANSDQDRRRKPSQTNKTTGGANNQQVRDSGAIATTIAPQTGQSDSPLERIIKSLTSSSDSSILKLIANTFTGGSKDLGAKKSKFAREYPCGAWKLAHVLVVSEYLKDSPRKDVKHIVLHSLYHYAMQFFACSTCGNRVSDVNNEFRITLDDHLREQSDSIMFLWKIHNRINKRLMAEVRPNLPPKVQFPTESLCLKCRAPKSQGELASSPNWHEKQVLNYLVHHYRPQSLVLNETSSDSSAAPTSSVTLFLFPDNQISCRLLVTASLLFAVTIANTVLLARHQFL